MGTNANDLMLAVLGSAVGLGGLLLVFCGFVFSQAAGFDPAHTDDAVIAKYKTAGRVGLLPFVGSVVNALLVVAWFWCGASWLYAVSLGLFVLLLITTAVYGAVVILRYL